MPGLESPNNKQSTEKPPSPTPEEKANKQSIEQQSTEQKQLDSSQGSDSPQSSKILERSNSPQPVILSQNVESIKATLVKTIEEEDNPETFEKIFNTLGTIKDINIPLDSKENTALHLAAIHNRFKLLEYLLKSGSDGGKVNKEKQRYEDGETALSLVQGNSATDKDILNLLEEDYRKRAFTIRKKPPWIK